MDSPQRTVAAAGAVALAMGVAGVLAPDRQVRLMGFSDSRAARPLLTVSSLAAVNTGLLYLLGAAKGWPGFPAFTVRARALMGGGLIALAASGRAPKAFFGGGAWELAGAAVTAAVLGRKRATRRLSTRSQYW
ncbi:hypothetical protein [Amycolatopsis sp. RTGN1]|uniref:hypothetical protein n=1 Tax=Amycolatopsis ponsaeliensis TaxID=2992142 RepID=UPI00254E0E22|nr:hypothetical protein [Amycolatopsis sp. RTGN1]